MRPRWVVASGVGLVQMLAFGTSLYLLTVLSQPIRADTGWPLAWIIGGMSAGQLAGAAAAPSVGRWIKRHGGRPALSVSSFLFAGGLGLLAVSPNLVVYFAGWMVIGLGMACGLYDVAFGALGRLYGLEARRAITTVTLWGGFASTVFWTLSGVLVTHVGWRWTCGVYALMHLAIALPIYRFLLPAAEPHVGAPPGAEQGPAAAPGLSDTAKAAVMLLGAVLMSETLVASIVSVHLVTLLRERGLSMAAAIGLGVFIGPTQVSARFGESMFGTRIHPSATMIVAVGAITLGVGLLPFLPLSVAAVALMSYGAGIGLVSISRGSLPLYLFGPLEAPVISGRIGRPIAITAALAPSIGALLIGRLGGTPTLWLLTAVSLVSVGAALALRRLSRKLAA
jgi:MFS family permease